MNWTRKSMTHLESDNGRFTICRVRVKDAVWYELWTTRPERMVSRRKTADEAKQDAELEDVF